MPDKTRRAFEDAVRSPDRLRNRLREIDLALDALDKSCALREAELVIMKVWYHFDALRQHPRFQEVERCVGLGK